MAADQSLQDREPVGLADRIDAALVRLDGLRDRPVVSVAAAVAIAAVVGAGWWFGRPSTTEPIDAAIPLAATSTAPADTPATVAPGAAVAGDGAGGQEQPDTLIVHVAGAVARPGIVELEPGDRVVDAITAAGGPVEGADVHQLNLAAPVSDGLQIRVPVEGEVVASPVGVPAAALPGSGDGGGPIDVNRAPAPELEGLPGIGPSLAAAIVEWRTEHGPFASLADLEAVPGIGPAKLAALADHATV